MHETNAIDNTQQSLPDDLDPLFAQLAPQDVEQFYRGYRLWSLQRDIAALQARIDELQQQIEHNARLMQSVQPSPITLSALTQLQAHGVEDTNLLDRMLERGDSWLDHTVQLLVRCKELGVIHSDYTQWCENALEGAYDWITTMDQASAVPAASKTFDENIEAAFLQKLMSEDDTDLKIPDSKTETTDLADQESSLAEPDSEQRSPAAEESASTITPDQCTGAVKVGTTIEQPVSQDITRSVDLAEEKASPMAQDEAQALPAVITPDQPVTISTIAEDILSPEETYAAQLLAFSFATIVDGTIHATVNISESTAEQSEQIIDSTIIPDYQPEDDLALPLITNPSEPDAARSAPAATTPPERPATALEHQSNISWNDEPGKPQPSSARKRPGLLARLFHRHPGNHPHL